ncbi:MAG: TolC family protein [Vicinamibacteria bacterium]|nr:TolC family protein [Vicinamibacteria bacterium]
MSPLRPVLLAIGASLALSGPATAQERPTLELGLEDAVKRALENNVDIAVGKYDPEAAEQDVFGARGAYDPLLTSTLSKLSRTSEANNAFAGAAKPETDVFTYNFGLQQFIPSGATLQVDFSNAKTDTNSVFASFNPEYESTLNLRLTQPLLRGRATDTRRNQIRVAKNNKAISDSTFRLTVVSTVSSVKRAYYNLIAAIDNLEARRKNLELAKKLLDENQIKVRVGTMAPLDVVAAEAEVASREEQVISAENLLGNAEDALKRLIFPASTAEVWPLRVVPTDQPTAQPIAIDADAAMRTAFENRSDLKAARKRLDNAAFSADLARASSLPGIDLVANYGTYGIGGTQFERDGLGGPITSTIEGGYGDALSKVFGRDNPTWSLGVNVSYPIGNRSARAQKARAEITRQQQEATVRRLELAIAAEVRQAARAVESNYKRVESTRSSRVLAERRLDAEQKKFEAGMSTNFFVTQAQRDLADARVAELTAIADYRKSLVDFELAQEAGIGGGGSFATVSLGSGTLAP